MGLLSLDVVFGSSWSPGKAKTGALLRADLAGSLFLISFLVSFHVPGLRVVHSPEEVALNKDLEAQWASVRKRRVTQCQNKECVLA